MDIRNYEDIEKKLNEAIFQYESCKKMWEAVKFPTKKDGTPFKTLSKNFENAYIGKYYPVETSNTPYLTVMDRVNGKWMEDHLQIYMNKYNDRLPQHNPERETRATYFGEVEILTVDEIKSEIAFIIEKYNNWIDTEKRGLEVSKALFERVKEKLLEAREIIYSETDCKLLQYALEDYASYIRYIK